MSIAVEPEATRLTATIGDKEISFETGAVAKQAHGAVLVRQEGTVVLATAVGRTEGREGADFFPLTVDVEEKMYAAGKIPGGFFKREGRAGEKAILTARMVDRPIRPLWPKGYKNEVQIIVTTFSADQVHPHDILAINGSSAALMLSPMPFLGPVGAVRIGRIDGNLVVNPTLARPQGVDARPDRLRHARGHHDGRGGRRADLRGGADRGPRPGPRRDQEAVPAPDRPCREGGAAQVGRRRRHRVAARQARRGAPVGHRPGRARRTSGRCRGCARGRDAADQRGLDGVRRPSPPAGAVRRRAACDRGARRRGLSRGQGAVRRRRCGR